jgi:hypothetical protein
MPTLDKKICGRGLPKRGTGKDDWKHLTALEVEKLLAAAKGPRHEVRVVDRPGLVL